VTDSYDVVTMGSATQDVFAKTAADTIRIHHDKGGDETMLAYPLGAKILIEHLEFQTGGGGTNTATTFARQGLKTGFLGKIGDDDAGKSVLRFLKKEKIDFLGAVGGQTGYSVILDSKEDDRTILTFKGCNNELKTKELAQFSTRFLYCSSMLGESYETMITVMKQVKKRGSVAFNPSLYQAKLGLGTLQRVLDHVDILVLNKEEAEILVGHPASLRDLLRVLSAAGPHTVIITDGKNGAHLFDGTKFLSILPAAELTVVETTGAGDAFASGYVAGIAQGFDEKKSLLLAMLNAESVIAHYGAKNIILTKAAAEKLLAVETRTVREEHI